VGSSLLDRIGVAWTEERLKSLSWRCAKGDGAGDKESNKIVLSRPAEMREPVWGKVQRKNASYERGEKKVTDKQKTSAKQVEGAESEESKLGLRPEEGFQTPTGGGGLRKK